MRSDSDAADLLDLDPATHPTPALHGADRVWRETNCYVDLWIELLPALGHRAEAALAFTVRQDFEGDQFTFFKFPPEDLQALFGLAVQELAIFDTVESHTLQQLRRGRPVLIEVDSYWLPDVATCYHRDHQKTTVAAIALDPQARRFGYFHGTGYRMLADQDFDGIFRPPAIDGALFPYVEFVKRDFARDSGEALAAVSRALLRRHLALRPRSNPVSAWRDALPWHLETLAARDMAYFHLYAFNLPRQLGANFELLASYLDWLASEGESDLGQAFAAARRIADAAAALQFRLARMANRRKFDAASLDLGPIEADYDLLFEILVNRFA
ncbi:MAG: DUF1839 family protein [Reyranellaceae bacterium]